jgi:glycerate kinase
MKKIVVASDSFKGSLTSSQVADAVEQGVHEEFPDCEVIKLAVADGGEGTMDALLATLGGQVIETGVQDPLGRPINARYAIINSTTAVIEMSRASGLPLLKPDERNPLKTSTYGTGQLVADAISKGCRKIIMGIGGSATNDAGTGMLEALGYRFMDAEGNVLKGRGESLGKIRHIDSSNAVEGLKDSIFIVACDVDSPFCGLQGAAHVYAPQKGATTEMVEALDEGMRAFSQIIYKETETDVMNIKGAGAAGGLGGALKAFLDADLKKGADMVLDAIGFDQMIENADLVITGEGKIDGQTLTGKLPYAVARRASARNIPVIAICGRTEVESLPCFASICPVTPQEMSLEQAMQPDIAMENIRERLVRDIALSVTN